MDDKKTEVSKCLGWGMDLPEYDGKIFRLGEPTQGVKAEFELYLKRQAMQGTIEAGKGLPPAEDEKNRKLLLKDFGLGKYRWGGEVWRDALSEQDTIEQLILLLLEEGESKKTKHKHQVTREDVTKMLGSDEIGPWLMAGVFMVSGVDPTMALAMAQMTFAGAREQQQEAMAKMEKLISPDSADQSCRTILPFGKTFVD